jgi:hypothetical protein
MSKRRGKRNLRAYPLFMYTSNSRTYFSGVYPEPLRCAQGRSRRKGERAQHKPATSAWASIQCSGMKPASSGCRFWQSNTAARTTALSGNSCYTCAKTIIAMFEDELRAAVERRNRKEICQLIEAVPGERWQYTGGPVRAEVWYGSVYIVVQHVSGGSGINTYDTVSVNVLLPDGRKEFAGAYSAEELRLPNYISPSERRGRGRV